MGDPIQYPKMIDDMGGQYTHASEAYRAGKRAGRQEFFEVANTAIAKISVEQESGPVNGPEALVATRGFHVAQDCAKTLRAIKASMDDQKKTV